MQAQLSTVPELLTRAKGALPPARHLLPPGNTDALTKGQDTTLPIQLVSQHPQATSPDAGHAALRSDKKALQAAAQQQQASHAIPAPDEPPPTACNHACSSMLEEGQVSDATAPGRAEEHPVPSLPPSETPGTNAAAHPPAEEPHLPNASAEEGQLSDASEEDGQGSPHAPGHSTSLHSTGVSETRPQSSAMQQQNPISGPAAKPAAAAPSAKRAQAAPLEQRLNPNNPAHDPIFAEQHRAKRMRTDAAYAHSLARKQKKKLIKRVHWSQKSSLTPQEHGYLLDLQGMFFAP